MIRFEATWQLRTFEDSSAVRGPFSYRMQGSAPRVSWHRVWPGSVVAVAVAALESDRKLTC